MRGEAFWAMLAKLTVRLMLTLLLDCLLTTRAFAVKIPLQGRWPCLRVW